MSQNANKNHPGSELEEIPIKYKAYKTKVIGRLNHDFWIYNQGLDNYKYFKIFVSFKSCNHLWRSY